MDYKENILILTEEDLKEIFSLFCSPTLYEKQQIYDSNSLHYYPNIDLSEEYSLCQDKKEFVYDAWRAILYFLHSRGFKLSKNGLLIDLAFIDEEFIRQG